MVDHHDHNSIFMMKLFHLLAMVSLTLTIPLSFSLISSFSITNYHHLLSLTFEPPPKSLLCSLFLYSNPNPLHILVACVSLDTLVNGLMGRIGPLSQPIFRPSLCVAWIILCALQGCVALGVESKIAIGVNEGLGLLSGEGRSMLSKVFFLLGLHETMAHWARMIVRPVVDDTVFGGPREAQRAERWALVAGLGAMWWWRLRGEVDALVGVVVAKKDRMMEIGFGDFLGWWLYYVTVVIGITRVVKGIIWVIMIPFYGRLDDDEDYSVGLHGGDKV